LPKEEALLSLLGQTSKKGICDRYGKLPPLRWRDEDYRRDPKRRGDRENPKACGLAA